MTDLAIEYLPIASIKPYERNARKHADKDVEAIVESIRAFGFDDPIGIWGKDNLIVEGHGRLIAAQKLGMDAVPCIRLDHLTDEQRRAYALAHNKTAELSSWLDDVLAGELADIADIDMGVFGFDPAGGADENPYTPKVRIPQYDIQGDMPMLADLYDREKSELFIDEINASGVSEEEKRFLRYAAERHCVFDYAKIAEYYAHATPEMQRLMEKSALVIIDFDDAMANGYVKLSEAMQRLREHDA